ncbi:hypothetical protein FVB32_00985 [Flagellimonas hymeniacidonis]|uniref:Uncharacterized protein n=1 Tax=Flagellimonas hymeniacidonis TaxID=2603628 RepID=A0A5C8V587_9FLAO|nr:hypothetical protein [Flagellimonas hymeniacidonis]TXN36892.1 hypothetical protein FVB32_00985 [Flagellimonas hymeniacidonis]
MEDIEYTSYRTTKRKLYELIKPFNYRVFTDLINPIISANRGLDITQAKWAIKLQSREVLLFLEQTGITIRNFGVDIQIDKKQISKKEIKGLIPEITNEEIEKTLNPIISCQRGAYISDPKWVRYVSMDELRMFLLKIGEPIQGVSNQIIELVDSSEKPVVYELI